MYLIFDIGGTHIRAAISDGSSILKKQIVDTPQNYDEALKLLSVLYSDLVKDIHIEKALCGIAGVLQSNKESLFSSPNLPDWVGKPLKKDLERLFSQNVYFENDAALAGLGEAVFGAGKQYSIVMYYTIGTGIGGVRIVDKKIDAHVWNFEPGHQIIASGKTVEQLASGGAIEKLYKKEPSEIHDQSVWNELEKDLAIGLFNSLLHWTPHVIVLGGGLINQNVISIQDIERHVSKLSTTYPRLPEFKKSQYGDESGLYGAIACLNSI